MMKNASKLAGKVGIVTGGSRGIGLAIAAALVARNVSLVICGRSEDALREARNQLINKSVLSDTIGQVEFIQSDVSDPIDARRLIKHAVARFGGLDILINNAGLSKFKELSKQSVDEWLKIIGTNLNGPFFCCREAIPVLRRRGEGWIINISSLAGTHPFANGAAYCASKAGLNAFSEALMQELRYDNIRVSCIAPGSVNTRFAGTQKQNNGQWKLSPDDVAQTVIDLLKHESRSLPSRVEIRPSRPRK